MALKAITWRDNLSVMVFGSEAQAGAAAALDGGRRIADILRRKETCSIIFAAAVSQHELLLALSENRSIDWRRVHAFHMDEYIGLPPGDSRTLAAFFGRYPGIRPAHFHFLDPMAKDLNGECACYEALLHEHPADLVFCGVGDNGHLAFNEPHVAQFEDPVWVKTVEIDDVSKQQQVNAGNFPDLRSVPGLAFTLTIPALTQVDSVICVAPTRHKATAVRSMLEDPVAELCPASVLRSHANAALYLDSDSGKYLL